MDYLKELVKVLKENPIEKLPSQEFINAHEEIALVVFKNFKIETFHYYDEYVQEEFSDWYQRGNWGHTLSQYKSYDFWKNAVTGHLFEIELLISPYFEKDFPEIQQQFLNDDTYLEKIYHKTKDVEYLKMMKVSKEEKNNILKNTLLMDYALIREEHVIEFSEDKEFIKRMLMKDVRLFEFLSDNDRLNDEYIQLLIDHSHDYRNFLEEVPLEAQEKHIDYWLDKFKNQKMVFNDLPEKHQLKLLEVRPDLISKILDSDVYKYKDIAIDSIIKNGYEVLVTFTLPQLTNLFKQKEDLDKIKPVLKKYIENYNNVQQISKQDNKIIAIISLNWELSDALKNNIFYQLNEMPKDKKIGPKEFASYVEKVKHEVEVNGLPIEKADKFVRRLKNKLLPEELADKRYPEENLYEYLTSGKKNNTLKM